MASLSTVYYKYNKYYKLIKIKDIRKYIILQLIYIEYMINYSLKKLNRNELSIISILKIMVFPVSVIRTVGSHTMEYGLYSFTTDVNNCYRYRTASAI